MAICQESLELDSQVLGGANLNLFNTFPQMILDINARLAPAWLRESWQVDPEKASWGSVSQPAMQVTSSQLQLVTKPNTAGHPWHRDSFTRSWVTQQSRFSLSQKFFEVWCLRFSFFSFCLSLHVSVFVGEQWSRSHRLWRRRCKYFSHESLPHCHWASFFSVAQHWLPLMK